MSQPPCSNCPASPFCLATAARSAPNPRDPPYPPCGINGTGKCMTKSSHLGFHNGQNSGPTPSASNPFIPPPQKTGQDFDNCPYVVIIAPRDDPAERSEVYFLSVY